MISPYPRNSHSYTIVIYANPKAPSVWLLNRLKHLDDILFLSLDGGVKVSVWGAELVRCLHPTTSADDEEHMPGWLLRLNRGCEIYSSATCAPLAAEYRRLTTHLRDSSSWSLSPENPLTRPFHFSYRLARIKLPSDYYRVCVSFMRTTKSSFRTLLVSSRSPSL